MNFIKYYTIILLIIVNILEIEGKFINPEVFNTAIVNNSKHKHFKRNVNGSNYCRPLYGNIKKKTLNLHYHPYSLISRDAVVPFKSCYYEHRKGIIICNEVTARYVYIFYLPQSSITDDLYGYKNNNVTERCNLANSKIREWSFWKRENDTFVENYDIEYKKVYDKDKLNCFKIEFENDCIYSLPVLRADYIKVILPSECISSYGSTKKNKNKRD